MATTSKSEPGVPTALPPSDGGRGRLTARIGAMVGAINRGDEEEVEAAVRRLSSSRRIFAPLTFAVGAVLMLFQGLRLLFVNWRLSILQVVPAMWIWVVMMDLKLHIFKGKEVRLWQGPRVIVLVLVAAAITAAAFYLNAVFAFAIARPGKPEIRPAFGLARLHLPVVVGVGGALGVTLGVAAFVTPHWGFGWYALSLSIVLGVMMLLYVTVPARIVGLRPNTPLRDRLAATAVAGAIGAIVCTPPYVLGRVGIVLLGSNVVLGVILLTVGLTLQSGATGAVKAIKMSGKLLAGGGEPPEAGSSPA